MHCTIASSYTAGTCRITKLHEYMYRLHISMVRSLGGVFEESYHLLILCHLFMQPPCLV